MKKLQIYPIILFLMEMKLFKNSLILPVFREEIPIIVHIIQILLPFSYLCNFYTPFLYLFQLLINEKFINIT